MSTSVWNLSSTVHNLKTTNKSIFLSHNFLIIFFIFFFCRNWTMLTKRFMQYNLLVKICVLSHTLTDVWILLLSQLSLCMQCGPIMLTLTSSPCYSAVFLFTGKLGIWRSRTAWDTTATLWTYGKISLFFRVQIWSSSYLRLRQLWFAVVFEGSVWCKSMRALVKFLWS